MDELELALDDCLQRLASGKANLAQCLARYPQYADRLRPMLEAALQVRRGRDVRPSGAVRARARARVMEHIEAHPRRRRSSLVLPPLALIVMVLACMLLLFGTGAAQAAMPGQPLYGLKLSSEQAWCATYPDRVSADLFLADRRASELVELASVPSAGQNSAGISEEGAESEVVAAYTDVLDRLDTETTDVNAGRVMTELEAHQQRLLKAGLHVPKLDNILEHAEHRTNHGQGNGKP
jgi:hypothetical protein